jgi:hypothetical protein
MKDLNMRFYSCSLLLNLVLRVTKERWVPLKKRQGAGLKELGNFLICHA